jgi:hypothetical protein
MNNVQIAIIGADKDVQEVLYKGFRKFPVDTLILLIKQRYLKKSRNLIKSCEQQGISIVEEHISDSPSLEEIFSHISRLVLRYQDDAVVINVDTDYMTSCLALSSAFVNGIQAMGILDDEIIVYPVMKFSYYSAINQKKMEILSAIYERGTIPSMEELGREISMSLPLVAYHLRGNRESKGLIAMNLVHTERVDGAISLSLTDLGRLIVSGTIAYQKSTG